MNFINAIKYLASLRPEAGISKKTLGLTRISNLLRVLGNPHHAFPVVHVGGTAGKGTTATMIASILQTAGYRVGLTLSPHLEGPRERIQINGTMIGKKGFGARIGQVARASRKKKASYFETLVAAALLHFARKKVDVAVVEVGLGGRLDATNVVHPALSVITNVDFDHTEVLGHTIAKIAREKAGIIKPGVPVITHARQKEALRVIRVVARAHGAPIHEVHPPADWRMNLPISIPGLGAEEDARIAKKAVEILNTRGWRIPDRAIRKGLKTVFIPGRFEIVSHKPLIILDGAHNPLKVRTLVKSVQTLFPRKRFTMVVAINRTKPYRLLLRLFKPIAARFVCTEFGRANTRKSHPASLLARAAGRTPATVIRNPRRAVQMTRKDRKPADAILITGSLYLVGEIRQMIRAGF